MSLALLQEYGSESSDDDDDDGATSQPPMPTPPSKPTLTPTPTASSPKAAATSASSKQSIASPLSASATPSSNEQSITTSEKTPVRALTKAKQIHTHKPKPRPKRQKQNNDLPPDLPPDLAAELMRAGHTSATISFETIDARPSPTQHIPQVHPAASAATAAASSATPATQGRQVAHGHAHVPASVVHKTAERISKQHDVTRRERRKHQITALAADAAALQTARLTFPHAGAPPARRRGHKS